MQIRKEMGTLTPEERRARARLFLKPVRVIKGHHELTLEEKLDELVSSS